jgi:hypothetical protein
MLTGYWSIDAFIIANILLWTLVLAVYFKYEKSGDGVLEKVSKVSKT